MVSSRKPYTPRTYGALITSHILDVPRNAVWAPPGLGKTVCALTAVDAMILTGFSAPTLVLAPLRVARETWSDEAKKWDHLRNISVLPVVGTERDRRTALKYDASVYTTNYEQLPWLIEFYGERWPFQHVIADESTKLKSFRLKQGGQRAQALGAIAHTKVKYFTQLTGTPASNGLSDLWGQIWMLDRGARLGRTFQAFKDRWFQRSFDGYGVQPLKHAQAEIQTVLNDICLTIDPKDYFDLKEPIVNNKYIELPAKARGLYKDMEKEFFMLLEGGHGIEAFNSAARSQKLLQLASGAVYLDPRVDDDNHPLAREWKEVHDMKVQALEEIVEESGGAPVMVAYHFKSDLVRLKRAFPDGRNLAIDSERTEFKTGKYRIGFGHPASIGHGVDGLQYVCNTIVYFSHDWNLEHRLQILERIGPVRQYQAGFERPVFVHNLIARDTIDELVIERVDGKKEIQDILMEAMKRRIK